MLSFKKGLHKVKSKPNKIIIKYSIIDLAEKIYSYFKENKHNGKAYTMIGKGPHNDSLKRFEDNKSKEIYLIDFDVLSDFYFDLFDKEDKELEIKAYNWINENITKPMCKEFDFNYELKGNENYLAVCDHKDQDVKYVFEGDHDTFEYYLKITH